MTALDAPAIACGRCGTFAPRLPFWGRMLCADCMSRETGLFAPQVTTRSLLSATWQLFGRVGLTILLINAVGAVPSALLELSGADGAGARLPETLLQIAVSSVCVHLAVQSAVSPGSASVGGAFSALGRWFWRVVGSSFLGGIIALFFALLLIVPGVMRLMSYALSIPIVLFERTDGSYHALEVSAKRMHGHRWAAFGAYMVVACATLLPPFIVFFVVLFAAPEDAANEESLLMRAGGALLGFVVSTLVGLCYLVTAALYLKLSPPGLWPVSEREHTN
jgi:hypothetical protein